MPFLTPDDIQRRRVGVRRRATGGEEIQNYSFSDIDERVERQNEEYLRLYESIIREIVKAQDKAREQEERASFVHEMQFKLALLADRIVERLEDVRDEHRPRTYGAWDKEFYMAVRLLPEARRFVEDCEMECIEVKKE